MFLSQLSSHAARGRETTRTTRIHKVEKNGPPARKSKSNTLGKKKKYRKIMYVAIVAMKPSKEQPPGPGSSEPTGEEHLGINLVSRWGAEGARIRADSLTPQRAQRTDACVTK